MERGDDPLPLEADTGALALDQLASDWLEQALVWGIWCQAVSVDMALDLTKVALAGAWLPPYWLAPTAPET